ncbi:hypothetical protein DAEQUDRAFT_67819 [Daedalea quercina L-15889]|uniref:Uncharacterized protein n=1 Tax=Daedalea quercina L-15889 TaxID=1314783 RepID=A0A165L835_9APHY|nr:hypothetical protein DAEQUDRAFT_67819 [Daedalea quercina L-15889]
MVEEDTIELGKPDDDLTYFPAMLHQKRTPRLEKLEIRGALRGVRFNGPCASTLKHLSFRTLTGHVLPWPDSATLLDILAMLPSVETISLERRIVEPLASLIEGPRPTPATAHARSLHDSARACYSAQLSRPPFAIVSEYLDGREIRPSPRISLGATEQDCYTQVRAETGDHRLSRSLAHPRIHRTGLATPARAAIVRAVPRELL